MGLFLRHKNSSAFGFTLIETLVAIGIIVFGLVSALTLINTSLFYLSNINDRLIAANLSAEGIELIRNTRDNNWLNGDDWNRHIDEDDYEVSCEEDSCEEIDLDSYRDRLLKLNTVNGIYNYRSGINTLFKRKVSISEISGNEIRVISTVTWQRKGIAYTSSAEDHLFNWK